MGLCQCDTGCQQQVFTYDKPTGCLLSTGGSPTSTLAPYPRTSGCTEILTSQAAEIRATAASESQPSLVRSLRSAKLPVEAATVRVWLGHVWLRADGQKRALHQRPSTVPAMTTNDMQALEGLVMPYVESACASIPAYKVARPPSILHSAGLAAHPSACRSLLYSPVWRRTSRREARKGADGAQPSASEICSKVRT